MNAVRYLHRQSRLVQALVFLALFVLIAWLDLVLDHDLSLFALYLIPTLFAGCFLGARWGYICCLASAVVWATDDWGGAAFYHHTLIPYWNLAGRLIVLTVIVAIVNALKGALEDENEAERRGAGKNSKSPTKCRCAYFRRRPRTTQGWTSVFSTSPLVKWVATTMISFRSTRNV